jgi:prepilin-type N-terminal cleavage/methylation domain-containing protein
MSKRVRGFTLIELLIVVAIIAILAMIAVPNFLEAQVRAKHSRVVSDLRTIATGLEAYFLDANDYPRNFESRFWTASPDLTTPVAYLTTVAFIDPFALYKENDPLVGSSYYSYHRVLPWPFPMALPRDHWPPEESTDAALPNGNPGALRKYGQWRLLSIGPDRVYLPPGWEAYYSGGQRDVVYRMIETPYDPTNGSISWGNISRTQVSPTGDLPRIP